MTINKTSSSFQDDLFDFGLHITAGGLMGRGIAHLTRGAIECSTIDSTLAHLTARSAAQYLESPLFTSIVNSVRTVGSFFGILPVCSRFIQRILFSPTEDSEENSATQTAINVALVGVTGLIILENNFMLENHSNVKMIREKIKLIAYKIKISTTRQFRSVLENICSYTRRYQTKKISFQTTFGYLQGFAADPDRERSFKRFKNIWQRLNESKIFKTLKKEGPQYRAEFDKKKYRTLKIFLIENGSIELTKQLEDEILLSSPPLPESDLTSKIGAALFPALDVKGFFGSKIRDLSLDKKPIRIFITSNNKIQVETFYEDCSKVYATNEFENAPETYKQLSGIPYINRSGNVEFLMPRYKRAINNKIIFLIGSRETRCITYDLTSQAFSTNWSTPNHVNDEPVILEDGTVGWSTPLAKWILPKAIEKEENGKKSWVPCEVSLFKVGTALLCQLFLEGKRLQPKVFDNQMFQFAVVDMESEKWPSCHLPPYNPWDYFYRMPECSFTSNVADFCCPQVYLSPDGDFHVLFIEIDEGKTKYFSQRHRITSQVLDQIGLIDFESSIWQLIDTSKGYKVISQIRAGALPWPEQLPFPNRYLDPQKWREGQQKIPLLQIEQLDSFKLNFVESPEKTLEHVEYEFVTQPSHLDPKETVTSVFWLITPIIYGGCSPVGKSATQHAQFVVEGIANGDLAYRFTETVQVGDKQWIHPKYEAIKGGEYFKILCEFGGISIGEEAGKSYVTFKNMREKEIVFAIKGPTLSVYNKKAKKMIDHIQKQVKGEIPLPKLVLTGEHSLLTSIRGLFFRGEQKNCFDWLRTTLSIAGIEFPTPALGFNLYTLPKDYIALASTKEKSLEPEEL